MFRRSGSVSVWYVDGRMPDPRSASFVESLAAQRFRSIEDAASEEESVGWVTAADPSGDSFELEDLDLDAAVWLRVRIDKKKLPTAWLAIHRASAERSAGRRLSARERKELREELMDRLLPRVLPTVRMIDALWVPDRGLVLLFATSTNVRDEFNKLFFRTFAVNLTAGEPYAIAGRLDLDRDAQARLDEVSPVPWSGERPRLRAVAEPEPMATEVDA